MKQFVQILVKAIQDNSGKMSLTVIKISLTVIKKSLTVIIHTQVKDITTWDSSFLNTILSVGNNLYTCINNSIKKVFCY